MKPAQIAQFLGLFITLFIGTTGCDTLLPNKEAELIASGIIEANQVAVSSELGGQVIEVLVEEGETVDAGEVMLSFGDKLFTAQLEQAEAALAQAEANYDLVATGPSKEQRQVSTTNAERELLNAQQALDDLHENADLMAAQTLFDIGTFANGGASVAGARTEGKLAVTVFNFTDVTAELKVELGHYSRVRAGDDLGVPVLEATHRIGEAGNIGCQ